MNTEGGIEMNPLTSISAQANRVHPEPNGPPQNQLAPLPLSPQHHALTAKRSSVISGRPEDLGIPQSSLPVDVDEAEDRNLGKSQFNRQRSIITYHASEHRLELLIATFNLLVHIGTILTDLILLSDYSTHDQNVSAGALAVIRIIVGLVEVQMDYLHRGWGGGRFLFVPLIFFNLRIVIDYVAYVRDWMKFRNKEWANSDFRASVSFETFIGSLPSLIVQTYVIIVDPRPMQQSWTVAFVMTCLSISIDLLHHYKYVHVENSIYVAQFVKALISTGLRTVLVAELLDIIGRIVLAWMIGSFIVGLVMYYLAVRLARSKGRDDPFEYGRYLAHWTFGGLISATTLFVSIPFAPSHSVYDWWLGYLMGEAKMAIENFIMLAIVLNSVYSRYKNDLFFSVLAFTLVCYIGNLFACWFLHQHVRKQLLKRNIYSDTAIVKLFAHYMLHVKTSFYPESLENHGSAQTQLLYEDNTRQVKQNLQSQHQDALQRVKTMNQTAVSNAATKKKKKKDKKNGVQEGSGADFIQPDQAAQDPFGNAALQAAQQSRQVDENV